MTKSVINVGPMKSLNSLSLYLAPQLDELRNSYIEGRGAIPVWDLRNIPPKGVSIAALTSFLSISKKIRDFIGTPIEILIHWQPEFQGFLSDIGFVQIAREFDLYNWQGMLGGHKTGKTNPKTRIFYYSDLPNIDRSNNEQLIEWKDRKRQEIKHSIALRLSNLFNTKIFHESWSNNLESVLTITGSELIVNSLLHGNDIAFVGVQRSSRGITTAICDSGIGFPKSMKSNYEWLKDKPPLSHTKAIILASLLSKNKIGLYRAIDDVLATGGYVNMSSYDTEVRWENHLWNQAKELKIQFDGKIVDISSLGKPLRGYKALEEIYQGYYKEYDAFLVGSRVAFEIPFVI
ncbi:hypothetical protein GCM10027429_13070 [Marivirga atlantica]|uniref:Uncharacterized protein n=1 Tax=Marivirga atlantica TaxID=1548457 RepID=A0A937A7A0_9BACT|nr:hypothetical protein [Marivirga atlantica]MBL0764920.1 hypothetical protein [Marivirga atlantica]